MPLYLPPQTGGGGGGGGSSAVEDTVSLGISVVDAATAPDDDATFALALAVSDTADAPTETVSLGFPAGNFDDSVDAPTDTDSFTVRVWLTGNVASEGAPANVANANGQNDGTVATMETNALGSSTEAIVSAVGAAVPAGLVLTSVIYRGWFQSVNVVTSSVGVLRADSATALFTEFIMFSNAGVATTVNRLDGTFTFDLVAAGVDTLAKLQSLRVFHHTADAVAGVTPHVLTADAGCLEIQGAFV